MWTDDEAELLLRTKATQAQIAAQKVFMSTQIHGNWSFQVCEFACRQKAKLH